jgi:hypothetical protein
MVGCGLLLVHLSDSASGTSGSMNLYEILDVAPDAESKQIRQS